MKDLYKILGLKENASAEEIRARWIELTKRYHPDVGKANGADEKIKEINEAYSVLKDYSKRLDYDLVRTLRGSLIKKAQSRKERRFHIQKIVVPAGILVLFSLVGLVIFLWLRVGASTKSEVLFKIDRPLEKKSTFQVPPARTESRMEVNKEVPKEIKKVVMSQESPKIVEKPASGIFPKSEGPVKVGDGIPKEIRKEIPEERKEVTEKESRRREEPVIQVVPEVVMTSEMAAKVDREVPKAAGEKTAPENVISASIVAEPQPEQKPEASVKAKRVVSLTPSLLAKEEEVGQFLSNYIDRYHRKDIDGFLSFFSSKAVQNHKDELDGIRKIYRNFFGQSQELEYRLEDTKIEIYQNMVDVRARFKVDQILKKRGEEKIWKGNIRWVLIKEEGILKILSLDYQNEKSP
jgi:curved DNA-binding protein CbpA